MFAERALFFRIDLCGYLLQNAPAASAASTPPFETSFTAIVNYNQARYFRNEFRGKRAPFGHSVNAED